MEHFFSQLFLLSKVNNSMTKNILIIAMLTSLHFAEEGKGDRGERRQRISPERKAELITKFDKDGDGKLNKEELMSAFKARKAEMIAKFDKDGDGSINEEEKKAAREMRVKAIFEKADTDKDGNISLDDFKKIVLEMKGKRGSRKKKCNCKEKEEGTTKE